MVMVVQLCKRANTQETAYWKQVNCIVYKLYLHLKNMAFKANPQFSDKGKEPQVCVSTLTLELLCNGLKGECFCL